jgi:hypothetical protein
MIQLRQGVTIGAIALLLITQTVPTGATVQQQSLENKKRPPVVERDPFTGVPDVRLQTTLGDYTTYFTPTGMILTGFTSQSRRVDPTPQYFELKIFLRNAMPDVEITTLNPRLSRSDFFGGSDPSWLANIPSYAKVKYANLYPDVDLLFQIHQRQLDFRFVIAPGGDPANIRFQVHGAEKMRLTPEGTLLLKIQNVTFEMPKPAGYQALDDSPARAVVQAQYVIAGGNEIGLKLAPYDSRRTLIIAP